MSDEKDRLLAILCDEDLDKHERSEAVESLGRLPYKYPDVVEELERRTDKSNEKEKDVRKSAERALIMLQWKQSPPVEEEEEDHSAGTETEPEEEYGSEDEQPEEETEPEPEEEYYSEDEQPEEETEPEPEEEYYSEDAQPEEEAEPEPEEEYYSEDAQPEEEAEPEPEEEYYSEDAQPEEVGAAEIEDDEYAEEDADDTTETEEEEHEEYDMTEDTSEEHDEHDTEGIDPADHEYASAESETEDYEYESAEVPFSDELGVPPQEEWVDIALKGKIIEEIELEQSCRGDIIGAVTTTGKVTVSNQGSRDRVWGIDLFLDGIMAHAPESASELREHIFIGDLDPQEEFETEYQGAIESPKVISVTETYVDTETDTPPNFLQGKEIEFVIEICAKNNTDSPAENVVVRKWLNELTKVVDQSSDVGSARIEESDDPQRPGQVIVLELDELGPGQEAVLAIDASVELQDNTPFMAGPIDVRYSVNEEPQSGVTISSLDGASNSYHQVQREEHEEQPDWYDCSFALGNFSEFNYILNKAVVYEGSLEDGKVVVDWLAASADAEEKTINPGEEFRLEWKFESQEEPTFGYDVEFTIRYEREYQSAVCIRIPSYELESVAIGLDKIFETTEIPSFRATEIPTTIRVNGLGGKPVQYLEIVDKIPEHFLPPKAEELTVTKSGDTISRDSYYFEVTPEDDDHTHGHEIKLTFEHLEEKSMGPIAAGDTLEIKFPLHAVRPEARRSYVSPSKAIANVYPPMDAPFVAEDTEDLAAKLVVVHKRKRFRTQKAVRGITVDGEKLYEILIFGTNDGSADVNIQVEDRVPEGFSLVGDTEENPPVEKESRSIVDGEVAMKWAFELEPAQRFTIRYTVKGSGEYNAKKAQAILRG